MLFNTVRADVLMHAVVSTMFGCCSPTIAHETIHGLKQYMDRSHPNPDRDFDAERSLLLIYSASSSLCVEDTAHCSEAST